MQLRLVRASGAIDDEEDVELDEGGEYEEDGVNSEADEAGPAVQLEAIKCQDTVQDQKSRHERHRAVDQALGVDLHVVLAGYCREERGLDEPGQPEAEKYVEYVRAYRVADAHCSVTLVCDNDTRNSLRYTHSSRKKG